jgi:anti-sigma B factor antagonist
MKRLLRGEMTMFKRTDHPTSSTSGLGGFAILRRELGDRISVISAEGDLDLSTAPRLKSMLLDSLASGHSEILVDLSMVTFMDSTALSVLVGVKRRLEQDAWLAIVCDRQNVLQVFEFSGTDAAFAIYPTLQDALEDANEHAAHTREVG